MSRIEKPEQVETLDKKQKRFDGFSDLSQDGKRAFADLSSDLPQKKDGENYDETDIQNAISRRFDITLSQKTQNLNEAERAELEKIKQEILAETQWKAPKDAIEVFSRLRTKLYGIMAASDGKSQQKDKNFIEAQEVKKWEEQAKWDAFDRLKTILEKSEARKLEADERRKAILKRQANKALSENRSGDQAEALASLESLQTLA
jgi:hypothetical protein